MLRVCLIEHANAVIIIATLSELPQRGFRIYGARTTLVYQVISISLEIR